MLHFAAVRYHESRARVRYKETDQMGIAHHANYIVWFEIGRTDLCRATGFPYPEIEARGYLLVVSEIGCRYRSPFRYDDEVLIRTSIAESGSRAIRFRYDLFLGEELRAEGFTSHIWVSATSRKPVRFDPEVAAAFAAWEAGGGVEFLSSRAFEQLRRKKSRVTTHFPRLNSSPPQPLP